MVFSACAATGIMPTETASAAAIATDLNRCMVQISFGSGWLEKNEATRKGLMIQRPIRAGTDSVNPGQ